MWIIAVVLLAGQDVRDDMQVKPSESYRALLPLFSDADRVTKAARHIENLKPLAEHLDKHYGGNLTKRMDKAAQSGDSLRLWTLTMVCQSIALCFDEAMDDLSKEDVAKEKIRYALAEFAEIEDEMKAKGNDAFEQAVSVRRSITKAIFLLGKPDKFAENTQGIRKSLAAVYTDAAALTLRNSLRAGLKDQTYQAASEIYFKAMKDLLKEKKEIVEKGVRGDEKAVEAAVKALEEMYPAILGD